MKVIVGFFLVSFLCFPSLAQQVSHRIFNVENGLPSNTIHDVDQDNAGFIWLATNAGICRFDGNKFKTYTSDNGLPSNTFYEIFKDHKNRLWFVSFNHQLCYLEGDSIHEYPFNDTLKKYCIPEILGGSFLDVHYDQYGRLFYSTSEQYIMVDSTGLFSEMKADRSKMHIKQLTSGKLMQLKQLDPKNGNHNLIIGLKDTTIWLYHPNPKSSRGYTLKISPFSWLISIGNITFYIKDQRAIKRFELKGIRMFKNKNEVYIAGKDGLYKHRIGRDQKPHKIFDLNGITSVYADNEGGLWVTSLHDGLFYIPEDRIRSVNREMGTVPFTKVRSIEILENGFLILGGTQGQLCILDSSYRLIAKAQIKDDTSDPISSPIYDFLAFGNKVYFTHCVAHVGFMNINTIPDEMNPGSIADIPLHDVKSTDRGPKKYLSLYGDTTVLSIGSGELFQLIDNKMVEFKSWGKRKAMCFQVAADSSIYIGSTDGLYKLKNKLEYLGDKSEMLKKQINSIIILDNNVIVCGTNGYGVVFFDGDSTVQISKNEGLLSSFINTIAGFQNQIWVGTKLGINKITIDRFSPLEFEIASFTKSSGLNSNGVNEIVIFNTTVYAASNDGLNFFPTSITSHAAKPKIALDAITISGENRSLKKDLQLKGVDNNIQISYRGISFKDHEGLSYQYRLKGADNQWKTTNSRLIEFSNLIDGNYELIIYAVNREGMLSDQPVNIRFTVLPPFWKTSWFLVSAFLMIVALAYTLLKYRDKKLHSKYEEKARMEKEMNVLKLEAIKAKVNPHFTFNVLNSIQEYVLNNNPVKAADYLSSFAGLIRQLLEYSGKSQISLKEERELLEAYLELERLRLNYPFTHLIEVHPEIEEEYTFIPPAITLPFVENAILHGIIPLKKNGKIEVCFSKNKSGLLCSVRDNGIGRLRAKEIKKKNTNQHRVSMGVEISKRQLDILTENCQDRKPMNLVDLTDENNKPIGTQVEIDIPVNYLNND